MMTQIYINEKRITNILKNKMNQDEKRICVPSKMIDTKVDIIWEYGSEFSLSFVMTIEIEAIELFSLKKLLSGR